MRALILGFVLCIAPVIGNGAVLRPNDVDTSDTYICIPKDSTGFKYDERAKEWKITHFNIKDDKYLLTKKDGKWSFGKFGDHDRTQCEKEGYSFLHCSLFNVTFRFNRITLRFVYGFFASYLGPDDAPYHETPFIEIGTCSPL